MANIRHETFLTLFEGGLEKLIFQVPPHPKSWLFILDLAPFSISEFRRRFVPPKPSFTVRALDARTVNAKDARSELSHISLTVLRAARGTVF
jgi:hypothetical protein